MHKTTLVDCDGELCALCEDSLSSTPEIVRSWYPFGIRTRDFVLQYGGKKIGQSLRESQRNLAYDFKDEDGLTYQLTAGGKTKPCKNETRPFPCPKVRGSIETRYRDGSWQKRLHTGWVTIA